MYDLKLERSNLKLLINAKYGSYGTQKDSMYYELLRKREKITDMLFKIENRKRKIENLLCKI
jgi:hypothetical protein